MFLVPQSIKSKNPRLKILQYFLILILKDTKNFIKLKMYRMCNLSTI